MKPEDYGTPIKLGNGYVAMLCKFPECAECHRLMVTLTPAITGIFPKAYHLDLSTQMGRADMVFVSAYQRDGKPICEECRRAGKSGFTCHLCGEMRSSDLLKESFGDSPPDYLCEPCYQSVPAAKWDEVVTKLEDAHQYDFS